MTVDCTTSMINNHYHAISFLFERSAVENYILEILKLVQDDITSRLSRQLFNFKVVAITRRIKSGTSEVIALSPSAITFLIHTPASSLNFASETVPYTRVRKRQKR